MSGDSDDYAVEQFTLDESGHADLARLIETAVIEDATDEGGTIAFTESTFRFMFGSPAVPRDLFVRPIHRPSGSVVGFLGGIPRNVSPAGHVYKLGVPAWAAVHHAHQLEARVTSTCGSTPCSRRRRATRAARYSRR